MSLDSCYERFLEMAYGEWLIPRISEHEKLLP